MSLTESLITNYEPKERSTFSPDERISIWRLPKLVWASAALFSMNLIIGAGMSATSNIDADMYGHEVRALSAASLKPSPFTQVIDIKKRKAKVAVKLRPVIVEPVPFEAQPDLVEAAARVSLNIPRTSNVSYQPDIPVRTQKAVYETSERNNKFPVVN